MKRRMALAILLLCSGSLLSMVPFVSPAHADSTWNLGGSGDWSIPGNWSPPGVPDSTTTNVNIIDGVSTVTLDTSPFIGNLSLSWGNALTFSPGRLLWLNGSSVSNAGQVTLNGGGGLSAYLYLPNNVTFSGKGAFNLATTTGGGEAAFFLFSGITLTNLDNKILGSGTIYNGGTLINGGKIRATSTFLGSPLTGTLAIQGGTITNIGTMGACPGGVLDIGGTLTNYSNGTLAGGKYSVKAGTGTAAIQMDFLGTGGGEILYNGASISLNGAGASIYDGGFNNALSNLQANMPSSRLSIKGGNNFITSGNFYNAGCMSVGVGSIFAAGGTAGTGIFTQSWGTTRVDGYLFASSFLLNGGTVSGTGSIFSPMQVGSWGTLHPGNSPGVLTISGTYTTLGTLAIDILNLIGGAGTGYSQLQVTGAGTLGGTLQINLLPGAIVKVGDSFDILHAAGGLTGQFASVTGASSSFTERYTPTDVFLVATNSVPLPASLLLLAPGLVGLSVLRKRLKS